MQYRCAKCNVPCYYHGNWGWAHQVVSQRCMYFCKRIPLEDLISEGPTVSTTPIEPTRYCSCCKDPVICYKSKEGLWIHSLSFGGLSCKYYSNFIPEEETISNLSNQSIQLKLFE